MRASVVWRATALGCGLAVLVPSAVAGRAQGLADQLHRRAVRDLAAGKLLVSSRGLADPNFAKTVVLLAEFTEEGAVGFIVNRPAKVTIARLFPQFAESRGGSTAAFLGGPVVTPASVIALLRATTARPGTRRIADDVYLVSSREVLEEMVAAGTGTNRFRVYLGYAGWGPSQLETETARGAWHVIDGDADVIFDPDSDATWERQIQRTEALSAQYVPLSRPKRI